jgi:mono/diheme cytochrome c family protein
MKRVFVAAALLVVAYGARLQLRSPAPQPLRTSPPVADTAVARGHAVYERYGCSICHGTEGKGGFANPNSETDGKVPGVNFVAEGYTRSELRRYILKGAASIGKADPNGQLPPYRMPGWTGQMTDQEAGDLVEYLFGLYPKTEAQKWR